MNQSSQAWRPAPSSQPEISSKASLRLRAAITPATTQAAARSSGLIVYCPIQRLSETRWINGITAKESCRESTTWESTSRLPVACSPNATIVITAGMIARARVSKRRMIGRSRS